MALYMSSTSICLRVTQGASPKRDGLSARTSITSKPLPRLVKLRAHDRATFSRSKVQLVTADLKNSAEADTFLNKVTEFMANSPVNQAKKWLAQQQAGEYDSERISSEIDTYISDNKVMIFSYSTCPFCKKAKDELTNRGIPFLALELDEIGKEGAAIRAELAKKTDRTSVPSIWVTGEFIGGCNDGSPGLFPLINEGKLEGMINT
mmetsp:Transcript_38469/g.46422  ORF Transcript_38469/g.46422 Transcript_38469/m.46422 type:complete len:206 (-) Transcript_38469:858-1475(-)|eukprot:CAMPEP_0197849970 /NCGR_PEP_ID=MMETSP1438-20131217/13823_1 /TAXON_ID=1461541 /ORGANISM="Pterosperma sp., Strain CCMP1384" /LENGTH=205 /DNA_ID=CAMNT_0043462899 /DNA_START=95 /DNA_END=712 /DNA_ORIENTATION=+